jgi:hypothetical protein
MRCVTGEDRTIEVMVVPWTARRSRSDSRCRIDVRTTFIT